MEQSILETINYVRNVSEKKLSIANILSRISKTSASNLDTRSLEKELHQMIAKGLIDSSYEIVTNVNLKLNVETSSKDTYISNNVIEQVSSPKQRILTNAPSDIHLSNEHEPIALEQLNTSSSINNNISVCDFKDQIMRLNAEIEVLKSFFLGQIFVVKKSLEEKHQSVGAWSKRGPGTWDPGPQDLGIRDLGPYIHIYIYIYVTKLIKAEAESLIYMYI